MKTLKKILITVVAFLLVIITPSIWGNYYNAKALSIVEAYGLEEITEEEIVYISTLGQLLEYTFDFYAPGGMELLDNKTFKGITLVLTNNMDVATDTTWHKYVPDWQEYGWHARGTYANVEGNGYTIKNIWAKPDITSNGPRTRVSFFDTIGENYIRNLFLEYDSIKMQQLPQGILDPENKFYGYGGGLAEEAVSTTISNVHVKGDFYNMRTVGGVVDTGIGTTIDNCSFVGNIYGSDVGGIISKSDNSSVTNSFFMGELTGITTGGIVGDLRYFFDDTLDLYQGNVAIITKQTGIDFWTNPNNLPHGTLFGYTFSQEVYQEYTLKDNYVLNPSNYTAGTISQSPWGDTTPIVSDGTQVKSFTDISSFADKANLPNLDYVNHWYMDDTVGYPQLKTNFINVINLTAKEYKDNFSITIPNSYYVKGDLEMISGTVIDEDNYELTYFNLDGQDMLGKLALNSLPLLGKNSHLLIVKVSPIKNINFKNLENLESMTINDIKVDISSANYSIKYKLGDTIKFKLAIKPKYELTDISASSFILTQENDEYTLQIPYQSTIETKDIDINILTTKEKEKTSPTSNSNILIIVLPIVGGVLVLGAVIIFVLKSRKRDKK